MNLRQKSYDSFDKTNKCSKCGKNMPEPGKVVCEACLEKSREYNRKHKEWRLKKAEAGE